MFASKLQIRLPRRITAYFLLFGLAALVWLSVGAVYVAHSVTDSRSESASLRSLGRGSDRVVLALPSQQERRSAAAAGGDSCAKRGRLLCRRLADGRIPGPFQPRARCGKPAAEQRRHDRALGRSRARRVRRRRAACRFTNIASPLKAGGKVFGTLRLGIAQPSVWSYVCAGLQFAPLAFLGPACCMVAGAVLLNRMVRPVADIEQQLFQVATSPSVESCELREVPSVGAAAHGLEPRGSAATRRPAVRHAAAADPQSLEQGRQSRLDAVLNSIPDGVATTDADGRLTYTNLPMSVILGLEGRRRRRRWSERRRRAPLMTEQLVKRWQLAEADRAVVGRESRPAGGDGADARRERPAARRPRRPSSDLHRRRRQARSARLDDARRHAAEAGRGDARPVRRHGHARAAHAAGEHQGLRRNAGAGRRDRRRAAEAVPQHDQFRSDAAGPLRRRPA